MPALFQFYCNYIKNRSPSWKIADTKQRYFYFNSWGYDKRLDLGKLDRKLIAKSKEVVLSLGYKDFRGQVLEYLDDEVLQLYSELQN